MFNNSTIRVVGCQPSSCGTSWVHQLASDDWIRQVNMLARGYHDICIIYALYMLFEVVITKARQSHHPSNIKPRAHADSGQRSRFTLSPCPGSPIAMGDIIPRFGELGACPPITWAWRFIAP
eukprot:8288948-Pyramimonas_sp.AAC.1